jgi:hypothetical protein
MCICNRATGFSAVAVVVTAGVVILQIRSKKISAQSREKGPHENANDYKTNLFCAVKFPSKISSETHRESLETPSVEDSIVDKLETDSFSNCSDHVSSSFTNEIIRDDEILMISGNAIPSKGSKVKILNVSLLTEATEATTDEDSSSLWTDVTTFIGRFSKEELPLIDRFVI